MTRKLLTVLLMIASVSFAAAAGAQTETTPAPEPAPETQTTAETSLEMQTRIRITVGNEVIYASFDDNETSRAIIRRLPLTIPMQDLYSREMCYRFPDALPAEEVEYRGYDLGEIIYWTPGQSFVIMYLQNGEKFSMQHIGRLDDIGDVDLFGNGTVDVTFELAE